MTLARLSRTAGNAKKDKAVRRERKAEKQAKKEA